MTNTFSVFSYDFLYLCGIGCYFYSLIFYFVYLVPFLFFMVSLAKGLSNFFFNLLHLGFTDLFCCLFFNLYFSYSSLVMARLIQSFYLSQQFSNCLLCVGPRDSPFCGLNCSLPRTSVHPCDLLFLLSLLLSALVPT